MVQMKAVIEVTWKYCWLAHLAKPTHRYHLLEKAKEWCVVFTACSQLMRAVILIE